MTKQQGIQDSANAFDALMDAAVDAIIIIDAAGLIRRFNRSAENMFGYREADVIGDNVKLLMPEGLLHPTGR